MLTGYYTLRLYCERQPESGYVFDGHDCPRAERMEWAEEYTGRDAEECYEQARSHGWMLDVDRSRAWCPSCAASPRG